jgi:2-polyprenyl-3-methyl-5-hydroxy-6-metoxy-1,4-benzoquinol methylase
VKTKYTAQEKKELAATFKKWHYEFDLGDGIIMKTTRENHMRWHNIRKNFFMGVIDKLFNGSLKGKTFLDIGCNAGFWSFALIDRGASYGLAIDKSPSHIKQAEFVRNCIQTDNEYNNIEFKNIDVFDLPIKDQTFDLILALGILYHLTDPVSFLRRVYDLANYCVFIDTAVSTLNVEDPVLEIGSSDKYVCCGEREFSFVPGEKALIRMLHHTGFSNLLKPYPPQSKENNAFIDGSRVAIVAFKD